MKYLLHFKGVRAYRLVLPPQNTHPLWTASRKPN